MFLKINYIVDLLSRDFELGEQGGGNGKPNVLKVDILDTAGDAQFPAMRRYNCIKITQFINKLFPEVYICVCI